MNDLDDFQIKAFQRISSESVLSGNTAACVRAQSRATVLRREAALVAV